MAQDLTSWLADVRVLVCLGPGGVGKTTTAAALSIAAAHLGRRVAVLTVDPAARLKDALDLPERAGELHRVSLPGGSSGTLDAVLLDAKGLFDELVRRLAPTDSVAERILSNPVYRNIAGAFAGSDAYMALEQVLDLAASDEHDLIVVDTPPASHALDLFDAPERITALLQSRALEYLEEPTRILGVATSRWARGLLSGVLKAIERMTGLTLLGDISSLASDFGAVSPSFRNRAEAIRQLLRGPTTRYALVASPEPHGATDILAFAAEVERAGARCDAVIVNRVQSLALETLVPTATGRAKSKGSATPWPASLARNLVACAQDLASLTAAERRVIDLLHAGFAALDERRGSAHERLWLELPALSPAPVSLEGIDALARRLLGASASSASASALGGGA